MKIIVLAAGKGSRLGRRGGPKPLTLLADGSSILGKQLEVIAGYTSLNEVMVVVGYQKEKIMEAFPDLLYVYNPRYAEENTSKSLLRALLKVPQGEDVLWLNGDVVFHPALLGEILASEQSAMVVNQGPVGEEEVKYRANEKGWLVEVSKQVAHPQGEALGINLMKGEDVDVFRYELAHACLDHDYFEKGIEACIRSGMEIGTIPVARDFCTEIDFPEDLKRANSLIKQWKKV